MLQVSALSEVRHPISLLKGPRTSMSVLELHESNRVIGITVSID